MSRLAILVVWLLLLAATATSALALEITTDTILGPDDVYHGYPIIVKDGANPPTHLTILPGFRHYYDVNRDIYNGLIALGSSEIEMRGGEISGWEEDVTLLDRSKFRMTGGETSIQARDDSTVIIEPGAFASVFARDNSRILVDSPWDGSRGPKRIGLSGSAHARIVDGYFSIETSEYSTAIIQSGNLESAIFQGGNTIITGGTFSFGMHVSAGSVHLRAMDGAGTGGDEPIYVGQGFLHVYGTGLHLAHGDPDNGRENLIVGFLTDGDRIDAPYVGDPTHIILHEVPEPSTLALTRCFLASVALSRRSLRRRREAAA